LAKKAEKNKLKFNENRTEITKLKLMIAIRNDIYLTPQEYLDWEEGQTLKYEYCDGQIVAMTGGTVNHGTIAANIFYQLKSHLRGSGCRPLIFDVKLGVSENGPFHYPDVMVSCDERDKKATKVIYYPCLIFEVLSPSTEAFDRGKKFQNYRQISSLQEYVLVSAEQKLIEVFRLNQQGIWELHIYTKGMQLQLTSIDLNCDLDLVYEEVILE
jgi:Uma2 family endonuclease